MTRVNPIIPSFEGEIGPRMLGRVDFEKYPNAAEVLENFVTVPQGGMIRRPGSRYVAGVKNSANNAYLIAFEYNTDESYIIEGGANYFRFFKDQGQITVPETDAAITNGGFDAGITGWTDNSGAGSSISHDATNLQLLVTSNGTTEGAAEQGVSVGASYQSVTHALQFKVTGVAGDFITLRVGTTSTGTEIMEQDYGVGWHTVSFTPGAATVYVQFINARAKSIGIDNVSFLNDVPLELVTPYTAAQIQASDHPQTNDIMYFFVGGTTAVYKLLRFGDNDWSLEEVEFLDGPYLDQNIENILPANGTVGLGLKRSTSTASNTTLSPAATTGLGVNLTASSVDGINGGLGWQSTDVGRLVRIQQSASADAGYGVITSITSTTVAVIDIRRDFNVTTATTRWWLGAFSATTGYPSNAVFHQQRLWMGGITDFPQSIMASQSADIENMRPDSFVSSALTVEDDDALNFTLASTKSNVIRWMQSTNKLLVGTSGGEWVIEPSSNGSVLTATDINARQDSEEGSNTVRPVKVGNTVVFAQKAGKKVLDYNYSFDVDGYVARDLTLLAHRALDSGIVQMDFARQPESIVYCLRSDGQLAIMTYKPQEQKVSWGRIVSGGSFSSGDAVIESIAVIPGEDGGGRTLDSGDRDEVWIVVKRTINGATVRYIEFFEGIFEGPLRHDYDTESAWKTQMLSQQQSAFYVDSGLSYDGAAATTITGLSHLEGETVKILADGAVHPDKTVSSGQITLDYSASKVQIGLGYYHYYKSPKLNYGGVAGTAVGKKKRIHKLIFVLLDAVAFKFGKNLDSLVDVEFRQVSDAMDTAVPLFVGEKRKDFGGGWITDSRIHIRSDNPSSLGILAIAPEMKTNDIK